MIWVGMGLGRDSICESLLFSRQPMHEASWDHYWPVYLFTIFLECCAGLLIVLFTGQARSKLRILGGITLCNLLSHPVFIFGLMRFFYSVRMPVIWSLVFGELAVISFEALLLFFFTRNWKRTVVLSFGLNLFSWIVGSFLFSYVQKLF
jgi:hypothetical protein